MAIITGSLVYRIAPNAYAYGALWPNAVPVGVAKDDTIYLFTDAKREQIADARRQAAVMQVGNAVLVGAFG